MGGERVIPPACVAAVHDTVGRMGAIGKRPKFSETCEDVARAVLDAFVAGEGTGPWYICGVASDSPTSTSSSGFAVCRDLGRGLTEMAADGLSREQADGFAAVLNYLEAKGE